jgi:hypothetical protein
MCEERESTYPVLSCDITNTTNRYVRHFKGLEIRLGLVIPDLDLTVTEIVSSLPFHREEGRTY